MKRRSSRSTGSSPGTASPIGVRPSKRPSTRSWSGRRTRGSLENARGSILRPVLILSADVFNECSGTVIAVALTSQPQRAGFPLTLQLGEERLPKASWAEISQIRALSAERIGRKISAASPEELAQIVEGLNEILGA